MASSMSLVFQHALRLPSSSNPSVSRHHKPRTSWASLLAMACLASVSMASHITAPSIAAPTASLIVDTRTPTKIKGQWTMLPQQGNELRKRQEEESGSATPTTSSGLEEASDGPSSITISFTPPTSTTEAPTPLPSPFDSSLAYNFTSNDGSSCPKFINDMLTSPTFKSCYPLSMMLQGSTSFFEAEKKLLSIVRVLDATCAADVSFCSEYLTGLAKNLTSSTHCGADFASGNPIVNQAYLGLMAYEMLYSTTCLQDPDTSMYCFANAVTNLTTPSNVYFYYLPLNMTLPGSANPSCNWCLQETMAIFQSAAADRKQAISWTYEPAAKQVNTMCGPEFSNDTLPAASVLSMAGLSLPSWALTTITVALAVAANFL